MAPPGPYPGPPAAQPQYSGRHRDPASSVQANASAAILLIAALVIGTAILRLTDEDVEYLFRPFSITGEVNKPIDLREMELVVLSVRGGRKLQAAGLNPGVFETPGLWLLVKVRVRAYAGTTSITQLRLRASDGRIYHDDIRTSPGSQGLRNRSLQPGIPVEGEFLFEVPRDVANDITVMVGIGKGADWLDVRGEVRLKSPESTVERWMSDSQPIRQVEPNAFSITA